MTRPTTSFKWWHCRHRRHWPAHIGSLDSDIHPLLSLWLVPVEHLARTRKYVIVSDTFEFIKSSKHRCDNDHNALRGLSHWEAMKPQPLREKGVTDWPQKGRGKHTNQYLFSLCNEQNVLGNLQIFSCKYFYAYLYQLIKWAAELTKWVFDSCNFLKYTHAHTHCQLEWTRSMHAWLRRGLRIVTCSEGK